MHTLLPNPAQYNAQLTEKQQYLTDLLAPFNAPTLEVFDSPAEYYRMRAEFRLWREGEQLDYAMFKQGDKHTPILLDSFAIASQQINELMPQLKAAWQASKTLSNRLFQIEFLTTLKGDAVVTLCYHRPLDEQWQTEAEHLAKQLNINIIGRSRKQRLVIGRDYALEEFTVAGKIFTYLQPEGAFTQPNGIVCNKMLNWAYDVLGTRNDDLLELYCGNGNFTLPLSTRVRKVLATEISKTSVKAALQNIADNHIDNISLVRLSAEELTQALNQVRPFNRLANVDLTSYQFATVFVDPPRAGMDKDTCELVRQFQRIIYISCNPETLLENIKQLADTHQISRCALFDQFPYTHHMETGILLERK
ncbi:tRNA (uridine(54)-C5)-methyltransferase TrmA [Entomomonas sp. E2T0]|uniref:tRNA (uridine(54)-C5)-methyltransferase TrmA n=1 Tax=Entomomonas sp. E2T0 TaxID=2930213 RepID=UPI0022284F12|nr:tRNA (uridine(54)-C5)-methyltransferase TrmA [Entomomonas sp. E2T0]UYZ85131.1 tRNA (uridine(54)-C5)-methyltransferase TrmA [Entomomonas sp. E2T0]